MILDISADLTYRFDAGSKVLLLIEAADGGGQSVLSEQLDISPTLDLTRRTDEHGNRWTVFTGEGELALTYRAAVEKLDVAAATTTLTVASLAELPGDALPWLWASRYCPSDRFESFVERTFGGLKDATLIEAILDWVFDHLEYRRGVSNSMTTAIDTLLDRAGVCRDYAHLTIALLRASGVPARAVSAYAWDLDPPDMHMVVEAFVGGEWRLFDPTRRAPVEGLVRIARGADAAHIAFMTVYGRAAYRNVAFTVSRRD